MTSIQFTPNLLPSDITGVSIYNLKERASMNNCYFSLPVNMFMVLSNICFI
ncbi:AAA family ATPase [Caldibacillus thermoamylovorans]|uniref:AAA family ATPase n=1 Tax=Caldibacillus thermoamylovorans TaxID=35841 RepID=UPI00203D48A7|nr:AAA family ATPase [Caldibacillus thermoamylovorans]MCM3479125.1 AAA family ATPase [Caldibacillus thermoamylovorans]